MLPGVENKEQPASETFYRKREVYATHHRFGMPRTKNVYEEVTVQGNRVTSRMITEDEFHAARDRGEKIVNM